MEALANRHSQAAFCAVHEPCARAIPAHAQKTPHRGGTHVLTHHDAAEHLKVTPMGTGAIGNSNRPHSRVRESGEYAIGPIGRSIRNHHHLVVGRDQHGN